MQRGRQEKTAKESGKGRQVCLHKTNHMGRSVGYVPKRCRQTQRRANDGSLLEGRPPKVCLKQPSQILHIGTPTHNW